VHITLRLVEGLPSLRRRGPHAVLREAIAAAADRFGFRLVHYSVQRNHVHIIAEASDRESLSKGVKGFSVRVARGLNRLWGRTGRVFADRYHEVVLRVPRQVRNALRYVLQNCWKHEDGIQGPDPFSSAPWFDGWREHFESSMRSLASCAVEARTWLLRVGWRRHGLISLNELPGRSPP